MRKLIVFDLDGTLVDTTNLSRESFFGVVKNYGVDADALWPLYNKTNGLPFRERITMVMPEFISRADEILAGITASHIKNIKKMVTAYPDIVETLEKIRIKKAILTSRVGESAFQIIKDILNHPFDYILTPEMTKLHKPNPEPLLELCARFRVAPSEAIFIGDTKHDIECGKRAGVATGAVTWGYYEKKDLKKYKPDYIIEKPSEILNIIEA
ncbi:MAG: HAD-superfamily hydrolase, subfamily IA [candidate division CPR2 bacterium GW2011_GWC1_39_9]|uniref:HAD-superfamily hydrolase, subfamily IA n=1 Tax=candidate division CPR2 bacterium GW2011_GWC2_39_10 TaxID=1618345 RepID=A0A0G0LTE0_UNCC2|nr:MAG: HAD-superfamily hydrolase, subfamily IA [candidate division CPR2 bacterium GW2011_GWC2_39_10]KKR33615.1 MAG: HAD-superfamily hydrolase, subfamily IA [candidate division CPR2 bacterium GW2011_GWC1_39_9]